MDSSNDDSIVMAEDPADQVSNADWLQQQAHVNTEQFIMETPPAGFWSRGIPLFLYRSARDVLEYLVLLFLCCCNGLRWLPQLFNQSREWFHRKVDSQVCCFAFVAFCFLGACLSFGFVYRGMYLERQLKKEFYFQDNLAIEENKVMIAKTGNVVECLSWCLEDRSCMTVVYSARDTLHECHSYLHTPYHYNFKTYSDNTSQIFLKRSFVSRGVQEHDGLFYFLSHRKLSAHDSESYCKQGSDFYHLAVFSLNSLTPRSVAINSYKRNYEQTGDAAGVIFEYIYAPISHKSNDTCSRQRIYHNYALARTTVSWDVDLSTEGYALCQGDPFNLYGDWIYNPSFDHHYLLDHYLGIYHGDEEFTFGDDGTELSGEKILSDRSVSDN